MPTTRSSTQQRSSDPPAKDASSAKRKRATSQSPQRSPKKKAKQPANAVHKAEPGGVISINRAPVLHLWSACVAAFLYEDLPWTTCLSVGAAISTLCAISKGQAIGAINKPDPAEADKKRQERREKVKSKQLDELEVMGFELAIEDGNAVVSGKPKKVNEASVQQKYGDDYAEVKETFDTCLKSWVDDAEDLNHRAFHMYEDFRPTVPSGQKGWGRKGQLKMETVREVVMKS